MTLEPVKLSIITINYHCEEVLQHLLDSAATLGPLPEVEWIIIDHSPGNPPLVERLRFPANVRKTQVIENSANKGFGHGCNLGAKLSAGEIIFFLNPDCRFQGGNLGTLVDHLLRDKRIGALNPHMLNADGDSEFSFALFPGIFSEAYVKTERCVSNKVPLFRRIVQNRFKHYHKVDWVTAGAMLIRRNAFFEVNGFDDQFFLYFEDVDLCFRLKNAGYSIFFDPSFALIHDHGHGGTANPPMDSIDTIYHRSQIHYYQKHKNPLSRILLRIYLKLSGKYPKNSSSATP